MFKRKQDTTVSLHPLKFDEAITKLTQATKQHEGAHAENSDSTTEDAPQSAPSKKQISRHRLSPER